MVINEIKYEIIDFYRLKATCDATGKNLKYAFYIIKDNEVVHKTKYSLDNTMDIPLDRPGIYTIKAYIKQNDNRISDTIKFRYNGLSDIVFDSKKNEKLIIFGVSKASATIIEILNKDYEIECIVDNDDQKVGSYFLGYEIKSIEHLQNNDYRVIIPNNNDINALDIMKKKNIENYEVITYNYIDNNIITRTMNEMSILQLYKVSRSLYLKGLERGAKYIKNFIFHKFNSVVPYTAQLSDNVKFGYGGIGVVVHSKAIIGNNVKISQNVTIGSRGETPIIGDNVFIGPGSKCLGGKIGSNVVIGANSVIINNIKDNCVVAGVPAKVISYEIEKYNTYFTK